MGKPIISADIKRLYGYRYRPFAYKIIQKHLKKVLSEPFVILNFDINFSFYTGHYISVISLLDL